MVYKVSILYNPVKIITLAYISLSLSVVVIVFTILNIFAKLNINIIILGICALTVIILLKLVFNHPWLYINEMQARYILETLPTEKMRVDYESNAGNIKKEKVDFHKQQMKKNMSFFSLIDSQSKIILIIYNVLTVFLICILLVLLITNILGIFTIYSKYIMNIIIIGKLILLLSFIKTLCIYTSVNKKLKEINESFNEG